ncbi:VanZ family protein [Blastococcus sp. TF02-09]|uniref:VanZ family protein n=1 Tax=Blastococcus sp. TF02-09 TaxID=2250576 RepID=UPI000DE834EA|nr:VanZ family protein [Blastococcus sp. TF02-9]RBY81233.1 VanZ family protein [Blastococcus sp. TF02-9]
MDDDRGRPNGQPAHAGAQLALAPALAVVAALTLTPAGTGWAWGAPLAELRWYATGLDSEATVLQLLGNLGLLAVPAGLLVAGWPAAGRPGRLAALAVSAATAIEVLQWLLPLGRVVSPLDAALNAVGAVAAGLLVRSVLRASPAEPAERPVTLRRG